MDGCAGVVFVENTSGNSSVVIKCNTIVNVFGRNGGTSGVYIEFDMSLVRIISSKGGSGGDSLFLGSNSANVQIDGSILASGEGGQGEVLKLI